MIRPYNPKEDRRCAKTEAKILEVSNRLKEAPPLRQQGEAEVTEADLLRGYRCHTEDEHDWQ